MIMPKLLLLFTITNTFKFTFLWLIIAKFDYFALRPNILQCPNYFKHMIVTRKSHVSNKIHF